MTFCEHVESFATCRASRVSPAQIQIRKLSARAANLRLKDIACTALQHCFKIAIARFQNDGRWACAPAGRAVAGKADKADYQLQSDLG